MKNIIPFIPKTFAYILLCLFPLIANAQTPVVKTLTPTFTTDQYASVSGYSETYFNGSVNLQGQSSMTAYFEYGTDGTFGYTTQKQTVNSTGTTVTITAIHPLDDFIKNYGGNNLYDLTIHHRLVAEDAQGNKYYGRDVPFHINHFYNPVRTFIKGECYDNATQGSFTLQNKIPRTETISYQSLEVTGSLTLEPLKAQTISNAYKYSVTSLYYNSVLFKQVAANNQKCTVDPDPQYLIYAYAMGTINNGKGTVYALYNLNTIPVPLMFMAGTGIASYTIPFVDDRLRYVVTTNDDIEIDCNESAIMIVSSLQKKFGYSDLLKVEPLYSTYSTATFEIQNNNNRQHEFILKNAAGNAYTYSVPANSYDTITVPKSDYDVYVDFPFVANVGYTNTIGNHYQFQTVSPSPLLTLTSLTSLTQSSLTSITANGTITANAAQDNTITYHFSYGTDPANLNLTTGDQQITIPAGQEATVHATLNGLATNSLYYCKLVVGTTASNRKEMLLVDIPKTNLTMHLRADCSTSSGGSAVSVWGDVSGNDNDAVQPLSASQPTAVNNAINGKTALRFDGLADFMTLPPSTDLGIRSNPYEMFIVAKSGSGDIQFLIAGGNHENFEYQLNGAAGSRFIAVNWQFVDHSTNGQYTNGEAHIFSARASASGGANRVDRADGGTTVNSLLSPDAGNLYLGARGGNALYFNGDIAEVIIYSRVLTPEERESVELYLYNRYFPKTISAGVNIAGSGTVSGDGSYSYGQTVTLTAAASTGYTFVSWTENGRFVSSDATYRFTVTGNRNLVAVFSLTDQLPVVKTLTPGISAIRFFFSDGFGHTYFNGSINPQYRNYTVYFEYGADETFGHTTPPQAVYAAGATVNITAQDPLDAFLNAYSGDIYNLTIHHRLVAEDAEGNKYYGRDVPFHINHFFNPARICIQADCDDSPTKGRFYLKNNIPRTETISYQSLENVGSITLAPNNYSNITNAYKYSVTSFYYNSVLFKQIAANNQRCTEDPDPQHYIYAYAMGTINNGAGTVYALYNGSGNPVPLTFMAGTGIASYTIPLVYGQLRYVVATNEDMEIDDQNNNAIMILSSLQKKFGYSDLLKVEPLYSSSATATFEIQNNNNRQHEFILKNAAGNAYTYSVPANSYDTITVPKSNYDVYVDFPFDVNVGYEYTIGNHYKFQSVSPGNPILEVSRQEITFSPAAASDTVQIASIKPWSVSSSQTWLTPTTTTGSGNATLTFSATANTGNTPRAATLTIDNGLLTQTITVTQQAEPGNALNFNGSNNYVSIPDNDAGISNAFTLEGWVLWQPDKNTDIQFICGKKNEQMELHTGGDAGPNGIRFIPTTSVYLDVPNALPTGVWTHIACTYDQNTSTAHIYINGIEKNFVNKGRNPIGTALQTSDSPFFIGSRNGGIYPFKGSFDEFRLWNRVLTQEEISKTMLAPLDAPSQTGLISYYNFNQGNASSPNSGKTTLSDLTTKYDGTLNNFALTGTASNWVESYAMVVPEAATATSITTTGFTANWTAPAVGIVDKYLLDVSTANDFGSYVGSYHNFDCGTALYQAITGLALNTHYYFRVRAEKASVTGQGAYSNVVSAQTADYSTSDKQVKTEGIRLYPNPTTGKLYIETNALQKITAIKLSDAQGKLIIYIPNPTNNEIDISRFNSGMYFIEIATENGIIPGKIIKR